MAAAPLLHPDRVDGAVHLLCRQDRSCADQHIRELLCHDTYGFLSGICAECNLCAGQSAVAERLCQWFGVFGIIEDNDRNDPDLFDLL